ncbi:MAG: CAP domain-containing protein [Nitrosopumilaceae archaeon]
MSENFLQIYFKVIREGSKIYIESDSTQTPSDQSPLKLLRSKEENQVWIRLYFQEPKTPSSASWNYGTDRKIGSGDVRGYKLVLRFDNPSKFLMNTAVDSIHKIGFQSLVINYQEHHDFLPNSYPNEHDAQHILDEIFHTFKGDLESINSQGIKIKLTDKNKPKKIKEEKTEKIIQKRYQKKSFSKALAVMMGISILVMAGIVYALEQGYIPLDFDAIFKGFPQPTTEPIPETTESSIPDQSKPIVQNCVMHSNGLGTILIKCPGQDTVQCAANPPIGTGIQQDVTLTIKNQSCKVEYKTHQGELITQEFTLATLKEKKETQKQEKEPVIPIPLQPSDKNIPIPPEEPQAPKEESIPKQSSKEELYSYALQLVNKDRADYGLNPVKLGNNPAAQFHADDMLRVDYFSHWNSKGVKPYVTYTELGGKGSVAENNAYTFSSCPTSNCLPNVFDPNEQISKLEYNMMYNDASSNWGHRDNILDPHHTHVNFGIAYDSESFYFVEHFEDNVIDWTRIELVAVDELQLVGKMPSGFSLYNIAVYSDPNPKTLTGQSLNDESPYNAGYYDQGNLVGMIVERPPPNSYYEECSAGKIMITTNTNKQCVDYVTFENKSGYSDRLDISADVSKWLGADGLHTIYVTLNYGISEPVQATSLTLEYLK